MKLPDILHTVSEALAARNADAIVVGGAVRDHLLGLPVKDYDIEVYGLDSMEQLQSILSGYGSVNLVGKQFGVLKLLHQQKEYDFSLPRSESKTGRGHRGFSVTTHKKINFKEASRRRDFTINSMGYGIKSQTILDPYHGMEDLERNVLRHIDPDMFMEDPLRVYRAVQFAARFEMVLDESTKTVCRDMVAKGMLDDLPKERIYTEWQKLLLKSSKPSIGFELMRELGIIEKYFPELHHLTTTPQSPKWHPEGNVWIHTLMALDAMAALCRLDLSAPEHEKQCLKYLLAVLCHDLGKPATTTIEPDGRIRAIGHEKAGLEPTKSLLYRLTDAHSFIASLLPLVAQHLKPSQYYANSAKDKTIRKLATKVNIEELVVVAKADFLGRTTEESRSGHYPAGDWLLAKATELEVRTQPLPPLIQGRDLIDLGLTPSPQFKEILDEIYERQLNGEFDNKKSALRTLRSYIPQ